MRWSNLEAPPTVRRFDAPEALDTRFYEVHARSALNRVPRASRMPFRWTVNPYRGCAHACVYCLDGATPILMGDGSTRAIADVRPGDVIFGTRVEGRCRRFVRTEVLDHWSTVKPAYRVTLADGTELIASGDHRFLTNRGWKHVIGDEQGAGRRPHLTLNNRLLGVGALLSAPAQTESYRRGYLAGMIRGDGHLGSYTYDRPGRGQGDVHRFRLALTDDEALVRTQCFLHDFGVDTRGFRFAEQAVGRREAFAIRTQAREPVSAVRRLIGWPVDPDGDWCRGFLGGIFDAEGHAGEVLRIANGDEMILRWTLECCQRLGLEAVLERRTAGVPSVRIRGGLKARLRFIALADPAITRKRDIAGRAVKCPATLDVIAIDSLPGARRLFDITTGTGDFIADGVVSHNCFARDTHRFLDLDAGRDFEREIVVKVNVADVLRAELSRPSWAHEHVALGTNTDPYQWVEGRYRLMRGIWAALRDSRTPCSVLTKSPLVLRDLDLLREIAEVTDVHANLSVPTIDEKAWRATEPRTPNPRARLEAVAELNRAGIPTGVLVAPLMPGINDDPRQVEEILALATEAGATSIGGIGLHLRGEVREVFMDWLRSARPDLVEEYERLYARGAYLPASDKARLAGLLGHTGEGRRAGRFERFEGEGPRASLGPPEAPRQQTLF